MLALRGKDKTRIIKHLIFTIIFIALPGAIIYASNPDITTYEFINDLSSVLQTGGIAGVHNTYSIEGIFQLSVNYDENTASFKRVDANLIKRDGSVYLNNLDEVFNMTKLDGITINDKVIVFTGKASYDPGIDITIVVTFSDNTAYISGQTIPPGCCDYFTFYLDAVAKKKYSGGTGEPNNPYQIATAQDLITLGETSGDYDKNFILTNDIDLDPDLQGNKIFDKAVIASQPAFSGVFDGNSYEISNLTIKGDSYLGLFGKLDPNCIIKDIGIVSANIMGTGSYIGALTGINGTTIKNCYSSGTVRGDGYAIGGLIGLNENSIIVHCHSSVIVNGSGSAIGGLAGSNENGLILLCNSSGIVNGSGSDIGGLVGYNNRDACISQCYTTSAINGGSNCGGLNGTNYGSIICCFSNGTIKGNEYIGGLVGENAGNIKTSYSTCRVSGNNKTGGLIGYTDEENKDLSTTSFWNIETSGQFESSGGIGLTIAQLQNPITFLSAKWDCTDETLNGTCDYWKLMQGQYPTLNYSQDNIPVMPEGAGTEINPYLIKDINDLSSIWYRPSAFYNMKASLNLSNSNWSMPVIPWFNGTLDGKNLEIKNLNINSGGNLGLFGQLVQKGAISNLDIKTIQVNGTGNNIGGLAGYISNSVRISDCSITGSISGKWNVGALAGTNSGTVSGCVSDIVISGDGGNIAGLIGENYGDITNCNCSVIISNTNGLAGGIAGSNYGSITNCNSSGSVSGNWFDIGGLVGFNEDTGSITSCRSESTVSGDNTVGGIIGNNRGKITTSYCIGEVNGFSQVGGFAGANEGNISMCYSIGKVTGNTDTGGFTGINYNEINASFWDIETSGQTFSSGGTGKITLEMKEQSTYISAGWDFIDETVNGTEDIWWKGRWGYPELWWEYPD